MAEIRLEQLRKEFGKLVAVRDISMTFPSGTVNCLLGPSGCGKTTLMRMIAGLETPTAGEVYFAGERVTHLSPSQRNIGMVFQYPVVYRGMSVYRNIEIPLIEIRDLSPSERKQRIESVLEALGLEKYAKQDVSDLDNGTRQKVSVARAVARQPKIILFDEPVTNVDVGSKMQLKRALKQLVKQHNQTIVYVTHDQTEAMTLADTILLMLDGEIVQSGAPRELYDSPNDRFAGFFLGNPGMNFIPCHVEQLNGTSVLGKPLFARPMPVSGLSGRQEVTIGIRPERVRVLMEAAANAVPATILHEALVVGGQRLLTLKVEAAVLKAKGPPSEAFHAGDTVHVECPAEHIVLFGSDERRLDAALLA